MADQAPIELFAVDLDDSLLGADGRVSARNRQALTRLAATGVEVCLLSGRMPATVRPFLADLRFVRYLGCYHGALVLEAATGRSLASVPLTVSDLSVIREWVDSYDYATMRFVGEDALAAQRDAIVDYYEQRTGASVRIVGDNDQPQQADVLKVIVYDPTQPYRGHGESDSERALLEQSQALELSGAHSFKTGYGYIEFSSTKATKGAALRLLSQRLDVALDRTAAIGDSYNDLDMMTVAGLSFAVANAVPDVLALADQVVAAHDADGVAQAAERIVQRNANAATVIFEQR